MKFRKYTTWKYFHPQRPFLMGNWRFLNKKNHLLWFFMPVIAALVPEMYMTVPERMRESKLLQKQVSSVKC